jgi:hypothetical protein
MLCSSYSFTSRARRVANAGLVAIIISSGLPSLASSEEDKSAVKGYELCLSKCVYQETRPPPQGSSNERLDVIRPRTEIVRTCKKQCASTDSQKAKAKKMAEQEAFEAAATGVKQ